MPNVNASQVSAFLQRAFRGREGEAGVFSRRELGSLLALLGTTDDPAVIEALIGDFRAALTAGSLDLGPGRRERISSLFAELHGRGQLPASLRKPAAGEDWVDVLTDLGDPDDDDTDDGEGDDDTPTVRATAVPASDLHELGRAGGLDVTIVGTTLRLGADLVDLGTAHRSGPALQALWGMLQPGWTDRLDPEAREALAAALARGFTEGGLHIPGTGAGKLLQGGVTGAAAALLGRLGVPESARAGVDAFAAAEPRPFLVTLLRDALGGPGAPEEAPAFRARIAWATSGAPTAEIGDHTFALDVETAAITWCGLMFCRTDAAAASFLEELPTFATALGEETPIRFDPAETQALLEGLQAYIDDSTTEVFQFGLWRDAAARAASNLSHAIAVGGWLGAGGSLLASPPTLGEVELDIAQAAWFAEHLGLIRNLPAAERYLQALLDAREVVPRRKGNTLPGTAFALFRRLHEAQAAKADASGDGRIDYADFPEEVRRQGAELRAQLTAVFKGLDAGTLSSGEPDATALRVDASFAGWFGDILAEHLASTRSLPNLVAAGAAFAKGGALTGEAQAAYRRFLDAYLAQWPDLDVFDFNKLERLAAAEVTGNNIPLCQINGRAVEPADFHAEVGRSVKAALQHIAFPFTWIAHRWGYRAKQAAELIDLLGERASQGKGPIATLRRSFPGSPLRVIATTSDLEYNSLVFSVERGSTREIYYLDSEGGVHLHARAPEQKHILFEAEVDDGGHVHVQHPARLALSPRAYPLMNTYGLGDRIDVEQYEESKEVRLQAAERFESRYTVRPGTIVGFDHNGLHRVIVHRAAGDIERTVTYEELRDWNNPHVVSETDGNACTVLFQRDTDKRFADDLVAMTKIANEHGLPEFDMGISEANLAKVQKNFLRALNAFTYRTLRYPSTPPTTDQDRAFAERLATGTHKMGEFLEVERGVCRHQFIREHMGKQRAGIDERFASGAANTYGGDFRGLHIWGEVSLADRSRLGIDNPEPTDARFLSDATWADPYVPLWDGAYGNDLRRIEMYDRTDYYGYLLSKTG
jgi:hypothetical protein